MRYTEKDIPGMPITAFLDALGENKAQPSLVLPPFGIVNSLLMPDAP